MIYINMKSFLISYHQSKSKTNRCLLVYLVVHLFIYLFYCVDNCSLILYICFSSSTAACKCMLDMVPLMDKKLVAGKLKPVIVKMTSDSDDDVAYFSHLVNKIAV